MKKTTVLFILVLALSSCKKSNEGSKILVADWLPGNGKTKQPMGIYWKFGKRQTTAFMTVQVIL